MTYRKQALALLWYAITVACAPSFALPQGASPPTTGASAAVVKSLIDSILPGELKAGRIPGAAIAVVVGDSILFSTGYGVASVDDTSSRVTAQALFRIASTTKMLTAAAVLAAQSQGLLRLDAPISTWSPGLATAIGRLTLRDLLRHTSGLREGSSYFGSHDEEALGRFVQAWSDTMLFAPADDIFSYSNLGYAMAGHILASASHDSYSAAMSRLLFTPLGMKRSTLVPTQAMTFPLIQGHDLDSLGRPQVVRPFSDDTRYWPAGSAFTSADEMARFVIALLNGGRLHGSRALPRDVVEAMLTRQTDVADGAANERVGYTFGLVERWRGTTRLLQHGGARIGFGSVVRMIPARRIGIVILANRTGALPARTLESLTTLLVPEASSPSSAQGDGVMVPVSDAPELLGHYINSPPELDLSLVNSKGVVALRQARDIVATPIRRLRDGRYSAGAQVFTIAKGRRTQDQYLVIASHALRKARR
ncbi:MAG TPA: serine hydrolase domain-containing protein [Gemmatimonadaceae bacterium]